MLTFLKYNSVFTVLARELSTLITLVKATSEDDFKTYEMELTFVDLVKDIF